MEIRVLIVDDEVDFLETMVNRLNKRDIETVGVLSGEEAIEEMKQKLYDVVILDIKMPGGMDGIEAFREIKNIQPLAKVILLTGHASVETSIEGLKMGAFDYLMKPTNFDELVTKIGLAYERKSEQDQKIRQAKIQQLIRHPGRVFDQEKEEE